MASYIADLPHAGLTRDPDLRSERPRWRSNRGRIVSVALWWAALLALCAILAAPLLIVEAPPLLDYLNHLARTYVLAVGADDPVLSRMYAARWAIIPNLAVDLLLPALIKAMPVLVAGRVAAGVAIVLPLVGVIAYSRAVFGGRSYWPLAAGLVAYNTTVLLGFLNFQIGLGLAMLLAALWVRGRDRHPVATVLICAGGAVGLFFCHLMGLALFLVLAFAFELECIWRSPGVAVRRGLLSGLVLTGPLVLYLVSPFRAATGETQWLPAQAKASQLLAPFVTYDPLLDAVTAILVGVCLLGFAATGRLRVRVHGVIAMSVLLGAYVAAPFISKGTCWLDTRFAIMLGYLLFAAVVPAPLPRRSAALVTLGCAGLFAWRMATITLVWQAYQPDLDGVRAAIAPVLPGERVYVTSVSPEEAPEYWRLAPRSRRLATGVRLDYHVASLLPLEHSAFWPYLFADPVQQPLAVLEPYARLVREAGPLLAHRHLDATNNPVLCDYDYVLLLGAGGEPDLAHFGGDRLSLLRANTVAALYRVQPGHACPAGRIDTVVSYSHTTSVILNASFAARKL